LINQDLQNKDQFILHHKQNIYSLDNIHSNQVPKDLTKIKSKSSDKPPIYSNNSSFILEKQSTPELSNILNNSKNNSL